jgi:hypothetical protein
VPLTRARAQDMPHPTPVSGSVLAKPAAAKEEEQPETPEQAAKREAHRQEVLKELIATERDYLRDLSIIIQVLRQAEFFF